MDPLSVSASIVALLQLSSTVISYLSDIRDGPAELRTIRREVSSIWTLLSVLQDEADKTPLDMMFCSTLDLLNMPNGLFEQFRNALQLLASKLAPVEGWRKVGKAFKWPFEKSEVLEILHTIERQKALFTLARQNDHINLSRAIAGGIKIIHEGMNDITMDITNLHIGEKHKEIRRWLSAPDPSPNYNNALKSRYSNTGDWLLKSNHYLKWLSKSDSPLWLYGIPGCGKTILSSTILQSTISYCQSRTDSVVLYFYFDFNDGEKQSHEKMIRSLIIQIASQRASTSQTLESLYSSCAHGKRQPTYDALQDTLHRMMKGLADTYIVVDALDECLKRHELLASMEEFASWKDANLHILITSRREEDIEGWMESIMTDQERIHIQSRLVDNDIRAYVHDRLRTDRSLRRWQQQPKIQQEIEDTLMEKADGM